MAVSTTYSLVDVLSILDLTTSRADTTVFGLSGGGFAVSTVHNFDHVDTAIYDVNGVYVGEYTNSTGLYSPAVGQLGTGDVVVLATDTLDVYFSVFDPADGSSTIDNSAAGFSNIHQIGLASGLTNDRFAIAVEYESTPLDHDIYVYFANNLGVVQTSVAPATTGNYDSNPSAATFKDNSDNVVVTWETNDGSGTATIWFAIYDYLGGTVVSPTPFDFTSNEINMHPTVATLPDGGFVIAYEKNFSSSIAVARFDSSGNQVGLLALLGDGTETDPSIAVLDNGLIMVGTTKNYGSETGPVWRLLDSNLGTLDEETFGDTVNIEYDTAVAAVSPTAFVGFYSDSDASAVYGEYLQVLESVTSDDTGDVLQGSDGPGDFFGNGGNDTVAGGGGTDKANYRGAWVNYDISVVAGSFVISDRTANRDGVDIVSGVELFNFNGQSIAAANLLNVKPVGVDDTNGGDAVVENGDATAAGFVLANDTDPNSGLGDTKTVNGVRSGTEAAGGTFVGAGTGVKGKFGTLVIGAGGAYTYTLDNADPDTNALKAGQAASDVFTYRVVDSKGATDTAQVTINLTGANDAPAISSNGGGAAGSADVNENSTFITNLTVFDPDSSTINYSLSGVDANKVKLVGNQLFFVNPPDFELRDDVGFNAVYNVTITASDGAAVDTQALSINLRNISGNTITGSSKGNTIDATHPYKGKVTTSEEDKIDGKGGNDTIKSSAGNDTVKGGSGHDVIYGGLGRDVLTGNDGRDKFTFTVALGAKNADLITDFNHGVDIIQLENKIFKKIGSTLDEGEFYAKSGAVRAHDLDDRIIYNKKTGDLYFDLDGNKKGGVAAFHFATLDDTPKLDSYDFAIV